MHSLKMISQLSGYPLFVNVIWQVVVQLALISDFMDEYTNYMLPYISKSTTSTLMGILQTNVHLNFNSRIEIREIHLYGMT